MNSTYCLKFSCLLSHEIPFCSTTSWKKRSNIRKLKKINSILNLRSYITFKTSGQYWLLYILTTTFKEIPKKITDDKQDLWSTIQSTSMAREQLKKLKLNKIMASIQKYFYIRTHVLLWNVNITVQLLHVRPRNKFNN